MNANKASGRFSPVRVGVMNTRHNSIHIGGYVFKDTESAKITLYCSS
jgi:hypothetical protein